MVRGTERCRLRIETGREAPESAFNGAGGQPGAGQRQHYHADRLLAQGHRHRAAHDGPGARRVVGHEFEQIDEAAAERILDRGGRGGVQLSARTTDK